MQFAFLALGALKAVGSIVEGQEQKGILKASEANSRTSALYARQNAHTELIHAAADADAQRRRGREAVGEQVAAFGQSGFGLGFSAGDAIEDSATAAELDAMSIQYKGVLRARNSNIEATQHDAQANAYKAARKATTTKMIIGAATNFLSGATSGGGMKIA